jgi:hypothetical protein
VLAVNEPRPQCDQERADELDHERDSDCHTVDRVEVRPLHERKAADAERDQEREVAPRDAQRRRSHGQRDQRHADERAGAPHLRQLLRIDARVEDHLRDGPVDGEERCSDGDHRIAERRVRRDGARR